MPDTQAAIVGNLTHDPELRFTPSGAAVVNFSLAVTPRVKDGDEWRDGETSFYRVFAWRSLAVNVADSLQKGNRVLVIGTLRQRSWETDEGDKRSVVEVQADAVGPDLKWAIAHAERSEESGKSKDVRRKEDGDKTERRPTRTRGSSRSSNSRQEAKATSGGDFDEAPPF
jgi:single-strand DNA-binding protein